MISAVVDIFAIGAIALSIGTMFLIEWRRDYSERVKIVVASDHEESIHGNRRRHRSNGRPGDHGRRSGETEEV